MLLNGWPILPFDQECADVYAQIRHDREKHGTMIGIHDCQIAATALVHRGCVPSSGVSCLVVSVVVK